MAITRATVPIEIQNNQTMQDAFQFGVPGDLSWTLNGQNFRMDVYTEPFTPGTTPALTVTSAAGQIVVNDSINRIVNFNVPESVIQNALLPIAVGSPLSKTFRYEFMMFDNSSPPVRVPLMGGKLIVKYGVAGG